MALAWKDAGGGDDVVLLIHGFPFNSAMWRPQLESPPDGWRLIAPDLRGFGASAGIGPGGLSMDRFASDLVSLLAELGVARTVVCGLSMGGYIAFALQRQAPQLVRALVLSDTRAGADTPATRSGRLAGAAQVRERGTAQVVESMVPRLFSPLTLKKRPELVDEVRTMMGTAPADAVAAALEALAQRPDSTDTLRSIRVPTQIIVGADDVITPPDEAKMLARAIPGSRLEILIDAGHLPNLEQPEPFNAVLMSFLTGVGA
jgi:3-oxoadipate enol-lactonase